MYKYLLTFILLFSIGKASAASSLVSVLFFTADWCGPCKIMGDNLTSLRNKFAGKITFKTINVDDDGAQAQKNNIRSIPVTIVASKRFVGDVPLRLIESSINQAIDK